MSINKKRKALVWGAGGFVGGELLRLLVNHPRMELASALSGTNKGKRIGEVYAGLLPWTRLQFEDPDGFDWHKLEKGEWTVFSVLAHTDTMKLLPAVIEKLCGADVNIVDLSGDFRIKNPKTYLAYYGHEHVAAKYLDEFVYGLPEINKNLIKEATKVANPGCLATGAELAILPAASSKKKIRFIAIDGKTGSSGGGTKPKETAHHPNRMNNFRAYSQLKHQHIPEILGGWSLAGGASDTQISFVPQMAPMVRGIFTTAHIFLDEASSKDEVAGWYRDYYADAPFVRIVEGSPSIAEVWGTNRCDISVSVDGKKIVICTAIDNLVKGAAGQAVQNANIMNGWEETAGLITPAPFPV